MLLKIFLYLLLGSTWVLSQSSKDPITSFRPPLPDDFSKIERIDLDDDGDPDVLRYTIHGIPVQWIDDDDDMKFKDVEGDIDSDCLMIDRNKDGQYGANYDLIIDWNDENCDAFADIQVVVDYSDFSDKGLWKAHYWWFIDDDKDQVFNYINWNTFQLEGWDHKGNAKFFTDYHGNSTFLKVHTNTFNISDLRYSWENPFLFYDEDKDGQSEMAIRYIDIPKVNTKLQDTTLLRVHNNNYSVDFTHIISDVRISLDMDNDSKSDNELDYDLSIKLIGNGFDYSDQVHKYKSLRGLPEADKYFFDPRWRQLNELIFTEKSKAFKLPFEKGKWKECWLVYDEDDDCNRWERVEFYEPKDIFKVGPGNGGVDNNPQSDPAGDRGEWDLDFSGKGNLYVGKFDGRIHLFGSESGLWRIDQNQKYFQGWGGWRGGNNLQPVNNSLQEPTSFASIKYGDTDGNGFFDKIEYDLDGDKIFEDVVELKQFGINDSAKTINISSYKYKDFYNLEKSVSDKMWNDAIFFKKIVENYGLNTFWYSFLMKPKTIREKYNNGFWLKFYLYKDLYRYAELIQDVALKNKITKAYYDNDSLLRQSSK